MEDSFQFIIESPQHAQGHKKRPRLVTSCDNCRLKKIKCLQPSPETKCEACKAAKIPCRFRDRERYFAERSRAIAGPNSGVYATELRSDPAPDPYSVASSSSSPSNLPRSSSQSPKASGMVSPDVDGSRYYTPDSRHHMGGSHTQSSSISSFDSLRTGNGIPYNYANHVQSPTLLHYPANTRSYQHPQDIRSLQLYDPENPQRPHPSLMTHFIQVFFQKYGHDFTFLSYQDALGDFWEQRMSMVVANCIAAMAVRHSNLTDLSARDLHNISESYTDVAKHVLNSVAHIPSWDTMHGIMLLCWLENHQHRLPGFRTYYGMAVKMSQELGLQENMELYPTEYERNRARTTYAGLMQLHMTANSFRS